MPLASIASRDIDGAIQSGLIIPCASPRWMLMNVLYRSVGSEVRVAWVATPRLWRSSRQKFRVARDAPGPGRGEHVGGVRRWVGEVQWTGQSFLPACRQYLATIVCGDG